MRQLFIISLCFIYCFSSGQTINTSLVKSKADSILNVWVGKGLSRTKLKFKSAYIDKNDIRATYRITFPQNNYATDLIIYLDNEFNVKDSNFFRTFPDYVLQDRPNDLIAKDSALKIAKESGLCLDDILDIDFYRLYDSKEFAWIFRVANKKEREKQRRERSPFGSREPTCRKRVVNAKTGQIL